MSGLLRVLNTTSRSTLALFLAAGVAFGLSAPRSANADPGDAVAAGIIGLAIYCGATGKCTSNRGGGGSAAGVADAAALSRTEAMWVQGGLQNLGLYTGAIDGALGAGSRASIRAYQASIGAAETGAMTGTQVNDLVALSPAFAGLPAGDPALFGADVANDLDRDGVRQLQSALNAQGYDAGPVDGAFGGTTRTAIATYKAANGLPGKPVASRRLLAHLTGQAAPEPAGMHLAAVQPRLGGAAPTPTPAPAAMAAAPTTGMFDVLGVTLGMSEAEVKSTLASQLGNGLMFDTADAATIGADGPVSHGFLAVQSDWPAPPSEAVLALFDDARPELGALAVFRLIRMPDTVDDAAFDAQVMPDIDANYGNLGKVATGSWVSDPTLARGSENLPDCGALALEVDTGVPNALGALWKSGGGVRLAPAALASVRADCGEVLNVTYEGTVVRFGLWNSAALAGVATAPKIKF